MSRKPKTQVIEQTSKKWKSLQALGILGLLLGVVLFVVSVGLKDPDATEGSGPLAIAGILVFLGGCGVYGYARCMAWWHHG